METRVSITGITSDSRAVKSGFLFVAIPGSKVDGRDFIASAVENGAKAIVAPIGTNADLPPEIFYLEVENPREYLALKAHDFYKKQPPVIVAVTGTNGKTSTVNFVRQFWELKGHKAASLGTLGLIGPNLDGYSGMTTPDAVELHRSLAEIAEKGITHLAMEASSIGIEQHRMDGVSLMAGGYTNLTRDHLDYHGTMDEYKKAKEQLFSRLMIAGNTAVLNADIPEFAELDQLCAERGIEVWSYGYHGKSIKILERKARPEGQDITLAFGGETKTLVLPLVGEFQLMNVLCSVGLAAAGDKKTVADYIDLIPSLAPIAGRLQKVDGQKDGHAVYVDYAHTPDALENVLNALRPHTTGRLICVFGCGGNRDKGKRPVMGEIANRLADVAVITDDNPRGEVPETIRADIEAGIKSPKAELFNIEGRRNAIRKAITMMKVGDVLVIAGKGHENGQIFADHTEPFDDVEEARIILKEALSS